MREKFKACPCCGRDVELITAEPVAHMELRARATVVCPECKLSMSRNAKTLSEALYELSVSWNMRKDGKR